VTKDANVENSLSFLNVHKVLLAIALRVRRHGLLGDAEEPFEARIHVLLLMAVGE
jgi:hypothetical protein